MWRAGLIWLLLAAPLGAGTAEKVQDAFQGWLDVRGGQGALALWRAGTPVARSAHGLDPAARHELASLSKAITATCAMTLVADGTWSLETTTRDVLGEGDAALGDLITHSAGLWPDATQGVRAAILPLARARAPGRGAAALARGHDPARTGAFWYNNENYAVLGDMIAAETGQSYEVACRDRVLAPAGVDGAPSARVGPMLAWGGWVMDVNDYAAFLHHWYVAAGRAPDSAPRHVFAGEGYWYGAGMFVRPRAGGHNIWHFGGHCFPGQLNAGSFAVSFEGEWSVVLVHDLCVDQRGLVALDAAIVGAIYEAAE